MVILVKAPFPIIILSVVIVVVTSIFLGLYSLSAVPEEGREVVVSNMVLYTDGSWNLTIQNNKDSLIKLTKLSLLGKGSAVSIDIAKYVEPSSFAVISSSGLTKLPPGTPAEMYIIQVSLSYVYKNEISQLFTTMRGIYLRSE